MNNTVKAGLIVVGTFITAKLVASVATAVVHPVLWNGNRVDEGAASGAALIGILAWLAVIVLGMRKAHQVYKNEQH